MKEDYLSYEDAQKRDSDRREELDALSKRVQKLAIELKNYGYEFEMEETSNEYLIKIGERTTHILKAEKLPWGSKNTKKRPLEDIIRETVIENTHWMKNPKNKEGA